MLPIIVRNIVSCNQKNLNVQPSELSWWATAGPERASTACNKETAAAIMTVRVTATVIMIVIMTVIMT